MALARNRVTPAMALLTTIATLSYPMNGGAHGFAGGLAMLDSDGNLRAGATATGMTCVGRFEKEADNTDGDDGDIQGEVRPGVYRWANSDGGDEIGAGDVGSVCYIVDDETVAKTDDSSARSVAGVVVNVDSAGVWVASGFNLFAAPTLTPGGPFLLSKTVTVAHDDAAFEAEGDDGDSVDVNVGTALPANAVILGARYTITEVFAGAGVASLTMIVGFSGDTNGVIEAVDIFGDATGEYRGTPGSAVGGPAGGKQLVANFDPDASAGLDELTAGEVKIDVFYAVIA